MEFDCYINYPQMARESGFKFHQFKDGLLDWRLIGSLEVERILRDHSTEQIEGILSHLSEAPLGVVLDSNVLDSGIAKYFVLSQFAIQYLLFCRQFLDETSHDWRECYTKAEIELAKVKKSLLEANEEVLELHKKLTHMEKVHEVVYPCQLCTKSFISNEALNIHLKNRHHGCTLNVERTDTTASGVPKGYDLGLINTIKLELEIKQLKERLNAAEKELKQRGIDSHFLAESPKTSKDRPATRTTREMGIQSNLIEEKERDDVVEEHEQEELQKRKEQLVILQEKIQDFDQWREQQKIMHEQVIEEINRRLSNMAESLQNVKDAANSSVALGRVSPNVEDLERMLLEKVDEINKASTKKLEEVAQKIELNYKQMRLELETEILKRSRERSDSKKSIDLSAKSLPVLVDKITAVKAARRAARVNRNILPVQEAKVEKKPIKEQKFDETYTVENQLNTSKDSKSTEANMWIDLSSISAESDETYVKSIEDQLDTGGVTTAQTQPVSDQEDSFNMSQTIGHESQSDVKSLETPESEMSPKLHLIKPQQHSTPSRREQPKSTAVVKDHDDEVQKSTPQSSKPKPFTRKQSKRIVNKKILSLGVDARARTISATAMKKAIENLTEQRTQLKQRFPNFMATRNRIKKLVDKMCSTKLPEKAQIMLKSKQALRPKMEHEVPTFPSESSFGEAQETEASTTAKESDGEPGPISSFFKQRLEKILASPIHQPDNYPQQEDDQSKAVKPVPVPRKRVMFSNDKGSEQEPNNELEESVNESIV